LPLRRYRCKRAGSASLDRFRKDVVALADPAHAFGRRFKPASISRRIAYVPSMSVRPPGTSSSPKPDVAVAHDLTNGHRQPVSQLCRHRFPQLIPKPVVVVHARDVGMGVAVITNSQNEPSEVSFSPNIFVPKGSIDDFGLVCDRNGGLDFFVTSRRDAIVITLQRADGPWLRAFELDSRSRAVCHSPAVWRQFSRDLPRPNGTHFHRPDL
jgi:hypothetical protein